MIYRSLLRPVTLPADIGWEYAELPRDDHMIAYRRPDMPVSRHAYGTFTTSRPLTAEEMRHFSIEEVSQ